MGFSSTNYTQDWEPGERYVRGPVFKAANGEIPAALQELRTPKQMVRITTSRLEKAMTKSCSRRLKRIRQRARRLAP